ncbi:cytochrome P450 [Mycena capillaripes]|nr:cytochrome P450 [Mycena capillaripes]
MSTTATTIFSKDVGIVEASILIVSGLVCYILVRRFGRRPSTRLKGPSSSNFFFGLMRHIINAPDSGVVYEEWANEYGAVFSVPHMLGSRKLVLADPKAITHFFTKETYGYVQTTQSRRFLERLIGRGLIWAEGDSHKRQRRALNPAFSNASIRNLTPIFFDSAYKAKGAWDTMLEVGPSGGTIIEVQQWMNHISLDTIGLAGFSHDFGTLSGQTSAIGTVFDSIGSKPSFFDATLFMVSLVTPIFDWIPSGRRSMLAQLSKTMHGLADKFLATTADVADKSVIGLLVRSASTDKISHEEVIAQINVLLLAGYETTSISLTWALIELSRNSAIQAKLRAELVKTDGDLTWDDLSAHGSFLDAFVCEILRFHPPLPETQRVAAEDDILPLSTPIESADGELVDAVFVPKGTVVTMPIQCVNRAEAFWGADAKVFNPSRWLDESADKHRAQEIQGYRHILTFADGPRMCLGKVFALMEFKAVLSVLVRNFEFEFPKGPETEIGRHRNLLPRPKVEGEEGYAVPLLVRNYVSAEE